MFIDAIVYLFHAHGLLFQSGGTRDRMNVDLKSLNISQRLKSVWPENNPI